ncbi:MAG: hypothetical protein LUH05_05820, partial [Candidatus Gastranaerophilales bacterium]|nr:hypothetical protein [Candidatus Gastranaerophilales bacterium]
ITNAGLYRKFSSKNLLEKYSIKNENGCSIASMDLKVYKDSVYIINLKINNSHCFNKLIEILLQTAVEKALYNTSEKEVFVNLEVGNFTENKIKKLLLQKEFSCTENQSDLEKKMFGETFKIKITKESFWTKKIKENPILINK